MLKPNHPEPCPRCGALTFNWLFRLSRIWLKCDKCGFEDVVSNVPVAGAHVYSDTRTPST